MGLTQSVSASEVAQRTQVSIEEAEELLAAFTKHGGTGTHIGLDTFKQVLSDTQHLYDSPAFSPEAADLYFQIFDTTHDGLSTCSPKGWSSSRPVNQKKRKKTHRFHLSICGAVDPYEFVVGCSIVATGGTEQKAERTLAHSPTTSATQKESSRCSHVMSAGGT
jgi:hypothetical protein